MNNIDLTEHVRTQHAETVTPDGVTVGSSHMCYTYLLMDVRHVIRLECEFRRFTSPLAAVLAAPYSEGAAKSLSLLNLAPGREAKAVLAQMPVSLMYIQLNTHSAADT